MQQFQPRGIFLAFTKSLFCYIPQYSCSFMLDAMVAIVFYFRKRRARFTSPTTSLPVRPALLSSTIVSEVATVATRIYHSLCEWLLHSYGTAFSRISCAGRRQLQHKNNTILTPCLQCSDDTPLHECNMQRGWLQLLPMQVMLEVPRQYHL